MPSWNKAAHNARDRKPHLEKNQYYKSYQENKVPRVKKTFPSTWHRPPKGADPDIWLAQVRQRAYEAGTYRRAQMGMKPIFPKRTGKKR